MPTFSTAAQTFGGLSYPRAMLRDRYPDHQLWVYAAGLVDPMDASTATVRLVYQKDDLSYITLGSTTAAGAGYVKKSLGPFSVWETAGVPKTENIVVVRLQAIKSAGVDGELTAWNIWARWLPRSV